MDLGQRIKQARLEAGMSQRQLCGDVITRNMLSQIENGSAKPSMDTLRYLADQLERSVSFFLGETAASANQDRMDTARQAFRSGDFAQALETLSDYQQPDPVFDAEFFLLQALCCMELAVKTPENAAALLAQAARAGQNTPYYSADTERRRLLLLARTHTADPGAVALLLPSDDDYLLLQAEAALTAGDLHRCDALLEAARDHSLPQWLILRGDSFMAAGDLTAAIAHYRQAEGPDVYARLEQCYLKLEDYKMAYFYACKQR